MKTAVSRKTSQRVMFLAAAALTIGASTFMLPTAEAGSKDKKCVLVQSISGSDDPTRANLALVGAWGIAEAGHNVTLVLSGEATYLLNPKVAASTVGVGLGDAQGWFKKLEKHKVPIYYCGGCGTARDINPAHVKSSGAKAITAKEWGTMVVDSDRVVSY